MGAIIMNWKKVTPFTVKRVLFTVSSIVIAAATRLWPLGSLGNKVVWLTFYPAVMAASLYAGLLGGFFATILSCCVPLFGWKIFISEPFIQTQADWLSLWVFSFTCAMISVVSEAMRQSKQSAVEAKKEAQFANESKSIFLANMSHELRTPLNAILGYTQLMQKDPTLSEKNRESISIVNRSGKHLLQLINDILEIVKIESKKAQLNPETFDFWEMVQDIFDMFDQKIQTKKLVLVVSGLDQVPLFLIYDPLKVKMVLINLISNAIKFTDHGSITIRFSVKEIENLSLRLFVEVEDSGIGISHEEQEKLFQLFSQTRSGELANSGTGLGLAISQQYVNLMGGAIQVISQFGTGSKFFFDIGVKKPPSDNNVFLKTKKQIIGVKNHERPIKVLVVDDSTDNRKLLVKLLENSKFVVDEATNGLEAIQHFQENHPDLIWMDIRMPIMNGLEAVQEIKALPMGNETKILALSAHIFEEERESILTAGYDDYLSKPFSEEDVFSLMAKHLQIQYIYSDSSEDALKVALMDELTEEEMNQIENEKKQKLADAVLLLDSEAIQRAISEIGTINSRTAEKLHSLLQDFNLHKIWSLLGGKR
jgi:signal transduction histidine kinase/DNA-binding response OmpR family regulator